jgi:hypothetical protein
MPLTERTTIIAFKAGRAFRREGTNIVEPRAEKGAIVIERGEDDLLHFMWKNRVTEETEEVFTFYITPNSILADHILGSHFVPDRCQLRGCSASKRPCIRSQILFVGPKALRECSHHTS